MKDRKLCQPGHMSFSQSFAPSGRTGLPGALALPLKLGPASLPASHTKHWLCTCQPGCTSHALLTPSLAQPVCQCTTVLLQHVNSNMDTDSISYCLIHNILVLLSLAWQSTVVDDDRVCSYAFVFPDDGVGCAVNALHLQHSADLCKPAFPFSLLC